MPIDPQWLAYARKQIGLREIKGPRHAPGIMAMIKRVGARRLGINVADDETAWCGTFVADAMVAAGIEPSKVAVNARGWSKWGIDVTTSKPLGCIVVFSRDGGGHVGFLTGFYPDGRLRILGGNQGDAVNEKAFPVARVIAYRWPAGVAVGGRAPLTVAAAVATTGEG